MGSIAGFIIYLLFLYAVDWIDSNIIDILIEMNDRK